jgi:hypothetical protein
VDSNAVVAINDDMDDDDDDDGMPSIRSLGMYLHYEYDRVQRITVPSETFSTWWCGSLRLVFVG